MRRVIWAGCVVAACGLVTATCGGVVVRYGGMETATGPGGGVLEWVRIPGGTFRMGSEAGRRDEEPVHTVEVAGFEMLRTEVTVAQYAACVTVGNCGTPGTGSSCSWGRPDWGQHPINCVDWDQAAAFCRWAGGRLPTEAEWEWAARGGDDRTYPWGDEEATCARAVMHDGDGGCGEDGTWPVCAKPAGNTAHGLCDMAGNVWEWASDWYDDRYYGKSPRANPTGPSTGSRRLLRGGSWNDDAVRLRCAKRGIGSPSSRRGGRGIRCLRPLP